jgi:hypothetical protein
MHNAPALPFERGGITKYGEAHERTPEPGKTIRIRRSPFAACGDKLCPYNEWGFLYNPGSDSGGGSGIQSRQGKKAKIRILPDQMPAKLGQARNDVE